MRGSNRAEVGRTLRHSTTVTVSSLARLTCEGVEQLPDPLAHLVLGDPVLLGDDVVEQLAAGDELKHEVDMVGLVEDVKKSLNVLMA